MTASPAPGGRRRRSPAASGHAIPVRPASGVALAVASLAGLLAFAWPLVASSGAVAQGPDAPLLLGGILVGVLVVVLLSLGEGGLDVKAVALLGLLSAVGAVLRPLSAGTGGVELVFVVVVLGGRVLGPGFGFALGSTTLFVSALVTGGVGPWLPYQMLAASWVGLGAGLLPRAARGRREIALLAVYGVAASLAYGLLMNLSFWPFRLGGGTVLSFVPGEPVAANLGRFLAFTAATSLGWDVGRAVTTVVGVALLGRPVLLALRRTVARAAFVPATPPSGSPAQTVSEGTRGT